MDIVITVGDRISEREWSVVDTKPVLDKPAVLRTKYSALYQRGDEANCWLLGLDRKGEYLLADNEFGRLPISNQMRPRYIKALQSALSLFEDCDEQKPILEDLSELKGMFNRCMRRDQWDWLEVYQALGSPPFAKMKSIVERIVLLRNSLKLEDIAVRNRELAVLQGLGLVPMLETAIKTLQLSAPKIGRIAVENTQATRNKLVSNELIGESKQVLNQAHKAKLDRANNEHSKTLSVLKTHLEERGYVIDQSPLIDAFCVLKSGPAIFEVKSINQDNEHAQCRHALSQLYEYRYRYDLRDASLWIVMSARPCADWLIKYHEADRDIRILWIENSTLVGSSLDLLC
jgi:hypothetical protein